MRAIDYLDHPKSYHSMKLTTLHLKNFSVVKNTSFDFSPQINVLIGKNGAGKSHILKLIYASLRSHQEASTLSTADVAGRLKSKLAGVFKPDDNSIGRLVSRGTGRNTASVRLLCDDDLHGNPQECNYTFSTLGRLSVKQAFSAEIPSSVYLPSREALAMYEGFIQTYENRELSFDETYRDLCVQLSGAQLRGPRLAAVKGLAQQLEKTLGGTIRLSGGRFYRVAQGGNLEAHLLSEGLRKIGSVAHLLLNGSLMSNGFLFWDEPEANLNPSLVTTVARTLRSLAGFGMQIFIATHDFLLLSELALADEYGASLHDGAPAANVRYFGLNFNKDNAHVDVESAERLRDLGTNEVLEEFSRYYGRRNSAIEKAGS